MTEQRREFETIKERTFKLKLSDADVDRICKKAASVNMTPEELIVSFIGDLVDGTYTNGSDERMFAKRWFERCGFSWFPKKTIVVFAIENYCAEDMLDAWETIKECVEEMKIETDEEMLEGIREEMEFQREQLQEYFDQFVEWTDLEPGEMKVEMQKLVDWHAGVERLKNEEGD